MAAFSLATLKIIISQIKEFVLANQGYSSSEVSFYFFEPKRLNSLVQSGRLPLLPYQKFAKLEIRQTRILSNQSPTFVPTFEKQNISIHFFSDSNSKVFFSRRKKILQRQDFSKSTQISFGSIFFRFERKKSVGVKFSPSKKKTLLVLE